MMSAMGDMMESMKGLVNIEFSDIPGGEAGRRARAARCSAIR